MTLTFDLFTSASIHARAIAMHCVSTKFGVDSSNRFYRATAMLSAVYAVVVCLCVCVCVCLSHSGIVSKRLNVGSRKQRRTIAP